MNPRAGLLIVALLPFAGLAPLGAQAKRLTLDQTFGPVRYHTPLAPMTWASDGVHLMVMDQGKVKWRHPLTGETKDAPADAKPAARQRPGRSPRPSADGGRREAAESPDGKRVAFVQDHDLWVEDVETKQTRRLTTDGNSKLLNGILDWVYQEEVYGRGTFRAHWWSPDSERLAFLQLDESAVKEFVYVDHVRQLEREKTVKPIPMLYPKAGDPNPVVKLGVANVADGSLCWVDLTKYPSDLLVVRVAWSPSGRMVFQVQDRVQRWLDLNAADPVTGKIQTLVHETSDSWVNVLEQPEWLADGSFLWLSERTGFKHVYHHEADGTLRTAVTSGDWQVRDVVKVDPEKKRIVFTATKDGAVGNQAYRVDLDGKNLVRLTRDAGSHRVEPNGDGTLLLDTCSSLGTPPEQRLVNDAGEVLKVLGKSELAEGAVYSVPELQKIKARDGYEIDALWIKPQPFDPAKKHPVWIETYSGPDSASVHDSWSPNAWFQFLAQQGIVVCQVNVRSASGKGQKYTSACYRSFGKSELQDLEDAIDWFGQQAWIDTARVGITGWSYGGTMTAYALTHSTKFKLGVAGAGVYDWRLYDTIYTERYMDLPQSNVAGYRESSVIEAAKNLHGHLVLLHGTLDDNVHLQNTIHLTYALQMAGKDDFELMLYPKSEHGVGSPPQRIHMRKLIWRAIQQHLQPGAQQN